MNNIIKCKTNNFGEIIFTCVLGYTTSLKYKNEIIDIAFSPFIKFTKKKLKRFIEIIDKYFEIYEMTKMAIIEKYHENEIISDFFKKHFELMNDKQLLKIFGENNFDKINVTDIVDKLEYPRFYFDSCISKEVFLLVQYFNFSPNEDIGFHSLPNENDDIYFNSLPNGLWVEIDFDEEIEITDFLLPY